MMNFSEERFPEDISLGAVGGPEYKTEILASLNGIEQRNIKWSQSRAKYNVSYGIKTKDQINKLLSFFRTKKGKAIGFRFKDWTDYIADRELIGVGDDVNTVFKLSKSYKGEFSVEIRAITKLVPNSVKIYLNNKILSSDNYSVDHNKGMIAFFTPPTSGTDIVASFEFDVPVRFDIDHLPISIEARGIYSCNHILLTEIKQPSEPS